MEDDYDYEPRSSKINMRFLAENPRLLSDLQEIEQFDSEFWEPTKGLYVRTGSILRVPSSVYHRWGIEITDENREGLIKLAGWFQKKDYAEREKIPEIDKIEKSKHSQTTRNEMAVTVAEMTKEAMKTAEASNVRVCNIGTNTGEAAVALAAALHRSEATRALLKRTVFHLVDYSARKLEIARKNLKRYVAPERIRVHAQGDSQFFEENSYRFNAVFCLGHFHKKPFLDVLDQIHASLVDNGVIVSGDWHSSICDQPHTMYQTLRMMGLERKRLDMFSNMMGSLISPREERLNQEEAQAVKQHQQMWIDLMTQSGSRISRIKGQPRFYIGGAFRTTRTTMREFEGHGFAVEPDAIKRAFPRMHMDSPKRMIRGTDSATVMMGLRRKR